MTKYLLDNADVHALFDQQRRGSMPGIMDSGISYPSLAG
jgi:hypothetical protein